MRVSGLNLGEVKQQNEKLCSGNTRKRLTAMARKSAHPKSLSDLKTEITKSLGEGVITFLGDEGLDVPKISTGILAVDRITGGGFAKGTFVEIYGSHGGGKSSISQSTVAQVQKVGGACVYVDLENSLDPHMLTNAGVDTDLLMVAQPATSEDTLEVLERCLSVPDVSLVVVDSVAGMVPKAELEGDWSDAVVGLQARLMSKGMRKLHSLLRSTNSEAVVIWINQVRDRIGGMGFGPQTTTTGGRALDFWTSTRLEVSRIKNLGPTDNIQGHQVKVKVTKNRHAPPFKVSTFDVYYDTGISNGSTLLEWALEADLVKQKGSWFMDAATGEQLGQGKLNTALSIESDPALLERLLAEVTAT